MLVPSSLALTLLRFCTDQVHIHSFYLSTLLIMSELITWIKRISTACHQEEIQNLYAEFLSCDISTCSPFSHIIAAYLELSLDHPDRCLHKLNGYNLSGSDESDFFFWFLSGISYRSIGNHNQDAHLLP